MNLQSKNNVIKITNIFKYLILKLSQPNNSSIQNIQTILSADLPLSVLGVSSHRFLLALGVVWWPGVPTSLPGVVAPGVKCAGVESHILVLWPGVAPGVSAPVFLPGVSSQRVLEGVSAESHEVLAFLAPESSAAWSQRRFFFSAAAAACFWASPPFTTRNSPDLAFSFICFSYASCKKEN